MTEWFSGFVEANGLKVFYHRTGQGSNKPQILLLHGMTSNGFGWSRVARAMEETYDLIMTDARGHGKTQGSIDDFSSQLLGEDAAAVIRELGLNKPFLWGHSMGAMTAANVAADNPGLARAVILEDPAFIDRGPVPSEELQKRKQNNLVFQALPLEERIAQGRADNPHWGDEEIIPWAIAQGEYNPDIIDHLGSAWKRPWRDIVSHISDPLLLVTADPEKGAIVSPHMAEEATQLCKSCQVVHIAGAGHCIHCDRYPESMQVIKNYLGKN